MQFFISSRPIKDRSGLPSKSLYRHFTIVGKSGPHELFANNNSGELSSDEKHSYFNLSTQCGNLVLFSVKQDASIPQYMQDAHTITDNKLLMYINGYLSMVNRYC